MAGLVATFVFAAQMINFPVGAGTSGHLLGGALAAVLVGPWTAVLCLSVVLLVQALLMADGGITALGTNITLMAWSASGSAGWSSSRPRRLLPKRLGSVAPAAAVGALVSVPVAAAGLHPALRRRRHRPRRPGHRARPRWSAGTSSSASARRSITGLVVGQRGRRPPRPRVRRALRRSDRTPRPLEIRHAAVPPDEPQRRFFAPSPAGRALLVAGVASYYASSHPDGLEHVAEQTGFIDSAEDSADRRQPAGRLPDQGRRRRPPQRRPRRGDRRGRDAAARRRPLLGRSRRGRDGAADAG